MAAPEAEVKAPSLYKLVLALYNRILGITPTFPTGTDRSGLCGGNIAITPGADVFDYPSFIECTGNDGTINYTDEYGNIVANYPIKAGTTTNFRVMKVVSATATGLYRCYSK